MLFRSNIWHRQLAGEYLCVKVSNKACQVFIAEWRSYLVKLLDGNCMCHVGKVQRLFISGQLKYIQLLCYLLFVVCVLPAPLKDGVSVASFPGAEGEEKDRLVHTVCACAFRGDRVRTCTYVY